MIEDRSILTRAARDPDLVTRYGDGPEHVAELRAGVSPAASRPVVMLIHGGFWRPQIDRAHARPMAEALAAAGWSTVLPEYTRIARDPQPTLADLRTLLAPASAWEVPHDGRIILVGHSAGGHLVLWASSAVVAPTVAGTLALAPVADLMLADRLALGDGAVAQFLGEPGPRSDVDPCRMPAAHVGVTIVHGEEDSIVPISLSESYRRAHSVTQLIPVSGAGHFALIDPQAAAWSRVLAALDRWVA